jgi:xylan 1,4-beta-xylosidase
MAYSTWNLLTPVVIVLDDVLRGHWNWTADGFYVVSDCDAIQNIYSPHKYGATREAAAAAALNAGTDLDCGTYYQLHLPGAYDEGRFDDAVIDQALVRIYSAQIRLGMFDPAASNAYRALDFADVNTPESQALALRAAQEGIVLIKNDGTLPLNIPEDGNTTLAVIGPWANATAAQSKLFLLYHITPLFASILQSADRIWHHTVQGNYAGIAPFVHNPLYGISAIPGVTVRYAGSPGDPTTDGYPAALAAAAAADVVIYVDGSNSGEEQDRNLIRWSGERRDIMGQLAGLGKPFVLVQMGDQLDDAPFLAADAPDDAAANVSAILWAGFPGQAGGDALAAILTGAAAPAGRLPVTQYPADYVHQVAMTDMAMRPNATSGNPGRTYKWFDKATVPFGFGLHYTQFDVAVAEDAAAASSWAISDLVAGCQEAYLDLCSFRHVNITVENAGNVTSDFVVLGFISGEYGPQPYPIKELVAYDRLFNVSGGSTGNTSLNLTLGSLARHDESGNLVLYPGAYSLLVDVPTQAVWNFTLTGAQATLEQWPQDTGAN